MQFMILFVYYLKSLTKVAQIMPKKSYNIDTGSESYKTRFGKSYGTLCVFTLKFCFDRSYANTQKNYGKKVL